MLLDVDGFTNQNTVDKDRQLLPPKNDQQLIELVSRFDRWITERPDVVFGNGSISKWILPDLKRSVPAKGYRNPLLRWPLVSQI